CHARRHVRQLSLKCIVLLQMEFRLFALPALGRTGRLEMPPGNCGRTGVRRRSADIAVIPPRTSLVTLPSCLSPEAAQSSLTGLTRFFWRHFIWFLERSMEILERSGCKRSPSCGVEQAKISAVF